MINATRRSFLGGLISLFAVKEFDVNSSYASNMPRIYANGKDDDSAGLGALFRNEPVIFSKDKIGIDGHEGIIIHSGNYIINNTVIIPDNSILNIERAFFDGMGLFKDSPFFITNHVPWKDSGSIVFTHKRGISTLVKENDFKQHYRPDYKFSDDGSLSWV